MKPGVTVDAAESQLEQIAAELRELFPIKKTADVHWYAEPMHQDLVNIIRRGMPYTSMPAWPNLSDAQVSDLAYYVKTFSPDFANPERVPQAAPALWHEGRTVPYARAPSVTARSAMESL